MKVTYNWLKDYVAIKIPARALADKLTMAGLEVTSLEERGGDFLFEIEVTSNRPDWLGVAGIAREVAAITGAKLKIPRVNALNIKKEKLDIVIENKKDCPLYTAKIIRNVRVGPSPEWLMKRLELVGCRSVNNIVDITNYCLFETGEPLHAFDLDKLSGEKIIIRRAKKDEKITVIDGTKKILDPETLIIADSRGPVAIAGVMGGKDTEVSGSTKNILLEAAVFDPTLIRRAVRRLGLASESSYRFERGVGPKTAQDSSWRAAGLIREIAGGQLRLAQTSGITKDKEKEIDLDYSGAEKVLGARPGPAKIKRILASLGFGLKPRGKNALRIKVPHYRRDVNLEVDLLEEIARIYGYDRIPTSSPRIKPQVTICGRGSLVAEIKKILMGLGLNEVITYSLIDRALLKDAGFKDAAQIIELLNPLSREQEILRPTVLPGLLKCIGTNISQKQDYVNIFEVGNIFKEEGARAKEGLSLSMAVCGIKSSLLPPAGMIREELGILHLKGIIESLFARLGIRNYSFRAGQGGISLRIQEDEIGAISAVASGVLEKFDIKKKEVFVAEIFLEKVLARAVLGRRFRPLPRFPAVTRDISILLPENITADKVTALVMENGAPLLKEARITDYYKGKQVPVGFIGLTLSCTYRSDDRTLTEAEVNPLHQTVCANLTQAFSAKIRA